MAKAQRERGVDPMTAYHDPPGKLTGTEPGKSQTMKEYLLKKKKKKERGAAIRANMKKGGQVKKCGIGGYYRKKS